MGIPIYTMADFCEACPPPFEAANDPRLGAEDIHADFSLETYRPLPYQEKFHNLDAATKAMFGGIGIGKTVSAGAVEAFFHALVYNPEPHVGIVGGPTYSMLRDAIIPALRKVFPNDVLAGGSWKTAFSKAEMVLRLVTGTWLALRPMDGDNYERVRGIEAGWAWLDEIRLLRDDRAWNVVLGRLRQRVRVRTGWATTSPNGMDWGAKTFVKNADPSYQYVHATSFDNPYLPADYFDRMRARYSPRFLRQELYGEILGKQGAVYQDLSPKAWPEGNCIKYKPPRGTPVELWVDFGFHRPSAQIVQEVHLTDPSTGLGYQADVVVWELQGPDGRPPEQLTVGEWARTVRDKLRKEGWILTRVIGDPAGDQVNDQTHEPSAQALLRILDHGEFLKPTMPWQRSKELGEEHVRGRIHNDFGHRRLLWAVKGWQEERQGGEPVVWAQNSFDSHRNLAYPERRPGRPRPTVSDKDGENDHDTDTTRYGCVTKHMAMNPMDHDIDPDVAL